VFGICQVCRAGDGHGRASVRCGGCGGCAGAVSQYPSRRSGQLGKPRHNVLRRSATSSFRASPITATTAHCTAPACSAGVLVYHVGDWRGGTSVLCGVGRDFRDRGRLPPVFRYAIAHDHGCRTSGIVIMGTNPVAVRASGIGDPRLVRPLWTMRWRVPEQLSGSTLSGRAAGVPQLGAVAAITA
jgi:hypothetical protein